MIYSEGDVIEAVKDGTIIRGRLKVPHVPNPEPGLFWVGESGCLLDGLILLGFTVSVIEKAAPPLPTEPGVYVAVSRGQQSLGEWHTDNQEIHLLNTDGNWCDLGWGGPSEGMNLERWGPVPVTAKKVLDEVRKFAWADGFMSQLETVERHFGVSNG